MQFWLLSTLNEVPEKNRCYSTYYGACNANDCSNNHLRSARTPFHDSSLYNSLPKTEDYPYFAVKLFNILLSPVKAAKCPGVAITTITSAPSYPFCTVKGSRFPNATKEKVENDPAET
jgi:hypothetical protein